MWRLSLNELEFGLETFSSSIGDKKCHGSNPFTEASVGSKGCYISILINMTTQLQFYFGEVGVVNESSLSMMTDQLLWPAAKTLATSNLFILALSEIVRYTGPAAQDRCLRVKTFLHLE
jgi:hypothetical protein